MRNRYIEKIFFFNILCYTLALPIKTVSNINIYKDYTDQELLQQWQHGNQLAFAAIYHRYVLKLLAIAIDKTRDRDLAEELVQETFITFNNYKVSPDKLSSIMAFLYVVLKNKIMDRHRHNVVRKNYVSFFNGQYNDADNSTQALIETRELERLLNSEIEKLSPQCQKVFNMRRKGFMSNKEIALALEISENTVEQHMRKALRTLKLSFINHDFFIMALLSASFFTLHK